MSDRKTISEWTGIFKQKRSRERAAILLRIRTQYRNEGAVEMGDALLRCLGETFKGLPSDDPGKAGMRRAINIINVVRPSHVIEMMKG